MEIVPKPPPKPPIFEKILSFFSFLLFFFAIFSFSLLSFFERQLIAQKEEIEKTLSALESPAVKEMKNEIFQLQEKFLIFEKLLNSHSFPSQFFLFLEENTLKNVVFTSLSLDLAQRKAEISGIADSFPTLSKQYNLFKDSPKVKKVQLASVSLTPENKIQFKVLIFFNESAIK